MNIQKNETVLFIVEDADKSYKLNILDVYNDEVIVDASKIFANINLSSNSQVLRKSNFEENEKREDVDYTYIV